MVKQKYVDKLIGILGFTVRSICYPEVLDKKDTDDFPGQLKSTDLVVELARVDNSFPCPCGQELSVYYYAKPRTVRDLSYGIYRVAWLRSDQCRVECPRCQRISTEQLDWLDPL
jgi:hypothetical protein